MEFKHDKKSFEALVNKAANAAMSKSNIAALECVKIAAYDGNITITGNDTEIAIEASEPCCNIIDEGSTLLNAHLLNESLRQLPDGDLRFVLSDRQVFLQCKKASYTVIAIDSEQFPEQEVFDISKSISIDDCVLKSMIKGVSYAVATVDTRPVLKGIFFERNENEICMTALDGARLAHRKIPYESGESFNIIFTSRALNELSKLLKDDCQPVCIGLGERHCKISYMNVTLYARLLEGDYMNYKSFIPTVSKIKAVANARDFLKCVSTSTPLLQVDNYTSPIIIEINDGILKAYCTSTVGKNIDEMEVESNGDIRLAFRLPLLIDALKSKEDENILLEFNTSMTPLCLRPIAGDEFLDLVVPVREFNNDN